MRGKTSPNVSILPNIRCIDPEDRRFRAQGLQNRECECGLPKAARREDCHKPMATRSIDGGFQIVLAPDERFRSATICLFQRIILDGVARCNCPLLRKELDLLRKHIADARNVPDKGLGVGFGGQMFSQNIDLKSQRAVCDVGCTPNPVYNQSAGHCLAGHLEQDLQDISGSPAQRQLLASSAQIPGAGIEGEITEEKHALLMRLQRIKLCH